MFRDYDCAKALENSVREREVRLESEKVLEYIKSDREMDKRSTADRYMNMCRELSEENK
jgi:hypothetical protein